MVAVSAVLPNVGRKKDLVDVKFAGTTEHLFGRAIGVSFGESFATSPGSKVFQGTPPCFHFVIALRFLIRDEFACVVIKSHRARSMDFVANEPGRLIDEMDPIAKAIFVFSMFSR